MTTEPGVAQQVVANEATGRDTSDGDLHDNRWKRLGIAKPGGCNNRACHRYDQDRRGVLGPCGTDPQLGGATNEQADDRCAEYKTRGGSLAPAVNGPEKMSAASEIVTASWPPPLAAAAKALVRVLGRDEMARHAVKRSWR